MVKLAKALICSQNHILSQLNLLNFKSFPACVFPWTYSGKTYTGCTTAGGYKPWCAYDSKYKGGRWRYCTKEEIGK